MSEGTFCRVEAIFVFKLKETVKEEEFTREHVERILNVDVLRGIVIYCFKTKTTLFTICCNN